MEKQDLIRFIKNEGDDKFQQKVIDWINKSPENRSLFNRIKAQMVSEFKIDPEICLEKEYRYFLNRKRRTNSNIFRIASIIILLVLGGSGWYISEYNSQKNNIATIYEAPLKAQREIVLEDGSRIFLNSGSTLDISKDFCEVNRTVRLSGEAFFEVTKNVDRPFLVITESGMIIKVLGTRFNVKSYKNDKTVETTLVSGKVEIYDGDETDLLLTLLPKQRATFNKKDNKLNVDRVETSKITSWKEGVLFFDNEPISQVVGYLERWYGVKITIKDSEIKKYTFSGKFRRENEIKEVLELLEISSPISYEYNEIKQTITLKKRQK